MPRALVVDERYHYHGYSRLPAHCRVRVYAGENVAPVIVVTEPDDNEGTSITNCAETLWPRLIATYLPGWLDQAEELLLIEHYPASEEWGRRRTDTYDRVLFTSWRPRISYQGRERVVTFGTPSWSRLSDDLVAELFRELAR